MFLRFPHQVKQLLFSGLNLILAPSYLSGWVGGCIELGLKLTQPPIGVGAELGNNISFVFQEYRGLSGFKL